MVAVMRQSVSNALTQAQRCVEGNLIDAIKAQLEHGKESSARRGSFIDTVKKMFTGSDDEEPKSGTDKHREGHGPHRKNS